MGLDWNPNFPDYLGVEFVAANYLHSIIDNPSVQRALRFTARHNGDVDLVELYGGAGTRSPRLDSRYNDRPRPMAVDLYEAGDESYTIQSVTYEASAVTGIGSIVNDQLNTSPLLNRIQDPDDGLFLAAPALNDGVYVQFGSGAFPLDARVLSVVIGMRINLVTRLRRMDDAPFTTSATADNPWFEDVPMFSSSFQNAEVTWGEAKLDGTATTWSHWTPQQIRDFASGGTRSARITARAGPGYWRIDHVYMTVFHADETRVGVGFNNTELRPFFWNIFDLEVPAGGSSPALVSGSPYSLVARRITDYSVHNVAGPTILSWRRLRGFDLEDRWRAHEVEVTPLVSVDGLGDEVEGVPCVRFVEGPVDTDDSQPYELQRGCLVFDGQDAIQTVQITGVGTTSYGQVFGFVGFDFDQPRPEEPLACTVTRQSDGATIFSEVEITAGEVALLPNVSPNGADRDDQNATYRVAKLRFPETTTLTMSELYDITFSSTGTSQARAWRVGVLIAELHFGNQSYGGLTQSATGVARFPSGLLPVTSGDLESDLQVSLVEVPDPVTGVGVAWGERTIHHAETCTCLDVTDTDDSCAEQTLPFAAVTWSAAPSGAPAVVAYEIQRMDDVDDWQLVATVRGRLTDRWEDQEVRLGITSWYRVRVLREDDVTGDWSTETPVTMPSDRLALCLSSNAATGMGVVAPEVWTGREADRGFANLEAGDVTFASFYGRNRQVAFRPVERRGHSFVRLLLINALCSVTTPTMIKFSPLEDLAWAPVPYVCVRDGEGNRWLANVRVTDHTIVEDGHRYFSEVAVTEVEDRVHAQDTAIAQVTGPVQL